MDRRNFLKYSATLSSGLALSTAGFSALGISNSMEGLTNQQKKVIADYNFLYIPPLLYNPYAKRYRMPTLYIQDTLHEFYPGKQSYATGLSTLQHHCSYLGPTIKVKQGDVVDFSVVNLRSEPVTNHWHGLHIPGRLDGGPHQMIQPGETWNITMPIRQEAATCWYHDHTCGKTAEHVYFGHAGLFMIEDEYSNLLGLPNYYGENEIPLVVQDKLFNSGGDQIYDVRGGPIFLGDDMIVNGTIKPFLALSPGLVRFKILNGSNDRHYEFYFKDGRSFSVIGSDQGLLNSPIELNKITLYSGERVEIVVDFTKDSGGIVDLMAKTIVVDTGGGDIYVEILKLAITSYKALPAILPEKLRNNPIDWDKEVKNAPEVTRSFKLSSNETLTEMYINDRAFDMQFINEYVPKGKKEVWEFQSLTGGHPLHIHGCSFLILEVVDEPPPLEFKGWKDTVVLPIPEPGTPIGKLYTCKVLVEFNHDTYRSPNILSQDDEDIKGLKYHIPYMYHCHLLEHEDKGMMGQFIVYDEEVSD
ncbi:multicopper oxidase family protein [Spartinivicinus ruber]|uniref:multicopper oxidase family protein n=1 Tax=Spartinivicinus ruber TaxID=2683272 RepID=UPI0013D24712|nr:multicopper oxidase domain-containing protein [Spartinivicinus ruber]